MGFCGWEAGVADTGCIAFLSTKEGQYINQLIDYLKNL